MPARPPPPDPATRRIGGEPVHDTQLPGWSTAELPRTVPGDPVPAA
ncbi:hypothetical protein Daura_47570 [Dactylosporangium aurantiacum]|uniref:Uncharacterized protein n=1 Tax=Dactylosporangium aurantiacum TaxID=35754 RepID=A0A9Q9IJ68_9ACTN|nr:hypothetical protein [Dactylosporangium aurantiacum]MDG6105398.1 hypothetical protein [Dactylosporangium aurantiacum]UWZ54058.1 hypothetical protein Daura_47570 [Dactylosporangium aurantiacum]